MSNSVAIFLPSLEAGGAERSMANLAEGFAERGIEVEVILAQATGPFLSNLSSKVRIVDLASKRVLLSLSPLARYLKSRTPDVLLTAMDHASLVGLMAKRWAGVNTRVVVTVHKMTSQPRSLDRVGRRESLIPILVRWMYPWANQVIAVSRATAEDLVGRTGLSADDIKVIPNAVVTQEMLRLADEEDLHPWLALGEPVILGVGRLAPEKDFSTLIRAVSRVVRDRSCRLIILGDGPERSTLQTLSTNIGLEGLVDLPGRVDNPYGFMANASVLALPSAWESFGIAIVEAMACGTPVVATRSRGGVAEILEDGRYGPLVPVGDDEAMARAILETLDSPPAAELLRSRANEYSVERVVDRYLELF